MATATGHATSDRNLWILTPGECHLIAGQLSTALHKQRWLCSSQFCFQWPSNRGGIKTLPIFSKIISCLQKVRQFKVFPSSQSPQRNSGAIMKWNEEMKVANRASEFFSSVHQTKMVTLGLGYLGKSFYHGTFFYLGTLFFLILGHIFGRWSGNGKSYHSIMSAT